MNELRILDINEAMMCGAGSFKMLKDISIEFDDNHNCIYSCHRDHALVQARFEDRDVMLRINLKGAIEDDVNHLKDITLKTTLYKNEFKVINVRGEEVFVDVLVIDDSAVELLSLITPNAPDDIKNKSIISEFLKFLITINQERVVINEFSFDQCFMLDGELFITPLKGSDVVHVGDTETSLISSFNNFTVKMLSEILGNIFTNKMSHGDLIYKISRYEYYNSDLFISSITSPENCFLDVRTLVGSSCRGEIAKRLNSISVADVEVVNGVYNEDRLASYDNKLCKWGYLNLKGEVVVPFIYDEAGGFYEDVAVVRQGELYGSINRVGEQLLGFSFKSLLWQGVYNIYIFSRGSLFGIIDRNGNVIVEESYLSIGEFNDGCAVVQSSQNKLFGAINSFGEVVIEPIYDSLEPFSGLRTVAKKGGERVVLDIFGDKI